MATQSVDLQSFVPEVIARRLKRLRREAAKIEAALRSCAHKVQAEINKGERRICLGCGKEQQSLSGYYWSPATEKIVNGGEYDGGDWHYMIEARLDRVKRPTIIRIDTEELFKIRELFAPLEIAEPRP